MTEIEERLGYAFKDKSLLKRALTHISYARDKGTEHNELLEFLGDSILNFVIVDILVETFPTKREGTLAPLKAYLISEEFFFKLAQDLDIPRHILMTKGDKSTSVVADAFEALWGAVYLDSGRDINFVKRLFRKLYKDVILETVREHKFRKDYKTMLQEITQKRWKERPVYRVINVEGPDHAKIFTVEGSIKGYTAIGRGRSKKEAEQEAARQLVEQLSRDAK